jgi:C4-dicarboxylate transporter DctM subunit
MLRYGMSRRGAFGVVAGGGTLGILIPPSAPMVLYAYVTEPRSRRCSWRGWCRAC